MTVKGLFSASNYILGVYSVILASSVFIGGQTTKTVKMAREELEKLMNETLPFAQQMLAKHGEFFPYGCVITSKGEIVSIWASDGTEHPPSQKLIDMITKTFQSKAKAGEYPATAIAFDVRVPVPSTGLKSDAIAIRLDHVDGMSIFVFVPYSLETKQKITYGESFAQKGDGKIFAQH